MPLESAVTKPIIDYINSLPNSIAEKVKGSASSSGKADINACYRGRTLRIEVKTPDHKNKASKKQERNLEKWYRAGAIVMVAYSLDSVRYFLGEINKDPYSKFDLMQSEMNRCVSWAKIPKLRLTG